MLFSGCFFYLNGCFLKMKFVFFKKGVPFFITLLATYSQCVYANFEPNLIVYDELGEDACRIGYRPVSKTEAEAHRDSLVSQMGMWQITGLKGNWVIAGSGYEGHIKESTSSNTFCHPVNNAEQIAQYSAFNQALSGKHYLVENGDVILDSASDFSINSAYYTDGVYLIDKGHGWIRGEEDFIEKAIGLNGTEVAIETSKTIASGHSILISAGIGLKTSVVEAMITQSYGASWTASKTITARIHFNAPDDKNVYARVYATHQRFDTIEIRKGQVVTHSISYRPTGVIGKQAYFAQGQYFDEEKILENNGPRRATEPHVNVDARSIHYAVDENGLLADPIDMNLTSKDLPEGLIQNIYQLNDSADSIQSSIPVDDFGVNPDNSLKNSAVVEDGFYSIDYGSNWLAPDDQGVIYTMLASENAKSRYAESVTATYTQTVKTTLSGKVTIGILQAALNATYGYDWSKAKTVRVESAISTPETNNTFTKIYSNNKRIDIIEIKNGRLIAQTSTFIPEGFTAVPTHYIPELGFDQSENYSHEGRYVLGIPHAVGAGYISRSDNYVNFNAGFVGHYQDAITQQVILDGRNGTYDLLIKFQVPSTGIYDLGYYNIVKPVIFSELYYGWYGNYEIWENSPIRSDLGSKIYIKEFPKTIMKEREFVEYSNSQGFEFKSGYNRGIAAREIPFEAGKTYTFLIKGFIHSSWTQPAVLTKLTARLLSSYVDYKEVHFDTNGGTDITDMRVVNKRTLFDIPRSTKEGYVFGGWFFDEELVQAFIPGISLIDTKDSHAYLYAKWVSETPEETIPPTMDTDKNITDVVETDQRQESYVVNSGDWVIISNSEQADSGTLATNSSYGSTMSFVFNGDGGSIELYGRKDIGHGDIAIYVNDHYEGPVSTNQQNGSSNKTLLYKTSKLPEGKNEIKLVLTSSYRDVEIDYAKIVP